MAGGAGVERIILDLDRPAHPRVAVAGEALRDEPVHACLARGGQQRIGALGPQPVGRPEAAVQAPAEADPRQGGRLMDDRIRLGLQDGLADRARVEQVQRDRLSPERPHPVGVARRPVSADHLVPAVDELSDEPGTDRTARPRDEDSHRVLSCPVDKSLL